MTSVIRCGALALALLVLTQSQTRAGITVYTATDIGVGSGGAHPLSSAAAANFDTAAAAIGPAGLINFELTPLGNINNLTVAPGVSINGTDYQGNKQTVLNVPNFTSNTALDGFNITTGGTKYVEILGGTLTFTFANPTQYFGAYFTGVQSTFFSDTITFNDGTSQSVAITNSDPSAGGVTFVGFTDPGKSITSITINASATGTGADFIGIDDVRYQPLSTVPEPSSLALCLVAGLIGAAYARRKRALKV